MSRETRGPFEDPTQRKPDDAKLVGRVLGSQPEAEMRELLGDDNQPADQQGAGKLGELALSEEDRQAIEAAEAKTPEQRRELFEQWAKSISKDGMWIEQNFIFNDDGTVETKNRLNIDSNDFKGFPPGLTKIRDLLHIYGNANFESCRSFPPEIGGGVYMGACGIKSLEGLPSVVNGDLEVLNNKLTDLKGLPKTINGNFVLRGNEEISSFEDLRGLTVGGDMNLCFMFKVLTIPEGINVSGKIIFNSEQTELIADAKKKGYKVEVFR